jgi:hypothetical protein
MVVRSSPSSTSTARLLRATHRPGTARLHEPAPLMTSPTQLTCSVKCRRSPCSTRYSLGLVFWSVGFRFEQPCLLPQAFAYFKEVEKHAFTLSHCWLKPKDFDKWKKSFLLWFKNGKRTTEDNDQDTPSEGVIRLKRIYNF